MTARAAARGAALALLGALVVVALLGRLFIPAARGAELSAGLGSASAAELFSWWALATQNTLGVVVGATVVACLLGGALGASGMYGESGVLGLSLRLVEFFGSVPSLILIGILRLGDPSGGTLGVFATLSVLRTLEVAQLVRAHVLHTLPADFVEASRALGASRRWQLRVHVLPRLTQPLAVNLLLGAANLIGLEAALGFTGLGLPSHAPSWGGGLAVLVRGGSAAALACVVGSIGASCVSLYGLAVSLERRQRRAPGYAARRARALRELGAEGQGS